MKKLYKFAEDDISQQFFNWFLDNDKEDSMNKSVTNYFIKKIDDIPLEIKINIIKDSAFFNTLKNEVIKDSKLYNSQKAEDDVEELIFNYLEEDNEYFIDMFNYLKFDEEVHDMAKDYIIQEYNSFNPNEHQNLKKNILYRLSENIYPDVGDRVASYIEINNKNIFKDAANQLAKELVKQNKNREKTLNKDVNDIFPLDRQYEGKLKNRILRKIARDFKKLK
jgi:hypothetical protein